MPKLTDNAQGRSDRSSCRLFWRDVDDQPWAGGLVTYKLEYARALYAGALREGRLRHKEYKIEPEISLNSEQEASAHQAKVERMAKARQVRLEKIAAAKVKEKELEKKFNGERNSNDQA